jgi:hypothetical protein
MARYVYRALFPSLPTLFFVAATFCWRSVEPMLVVRYFIATRPQHCSGVPACFRRSAASASNSHYSLFRWNGVRGEKSKQNKGNRESAEICKERMD